MFGIGLVLMASAAWVALDTMRKSIGNRAPAFAASGAISGAQIPWLLGAIFVTGATQIPDQAYVPYALGTVLLNIVAGYWFVRAVQHSPLGLTIPYLSFTPVFSAIIAAVWIDQSPGWIGAVGILFVVCGAVFLNPYNDGVFNPLVALRKERGSLLMLGVSFIWSLTPVLDKQAVDLSSPLFHTTTLSTGIALGSWIFLSVSSRSAKRFFDDIREIRLWLVVAGIVNLVALFTQLSAYAYVDVSFVETIKRALGVMGAMILGRLVFNEEFPKSAYLGAALMAIGVGVVLSV